MNSKASQTKTICQSFQNKIAMSCFLRKIPNVVRTAAHPLYLPQRKLNLQEHISHSILNEHGINTPRFFAAECPAEAEKVARDLLTKNLIVKAQVMAGGRGLGKFTNGFKGGVQTATR